MSDLYRKTVFGLSLASLVAISSLSFAQVQVQVGDRDVVGTRPATTLNNAGHVLKASQLIGLNVHTADNDEVGEIKDLVIDADGRVNYAAVSFGGFLGMGDKLFAVPLSAIQFAHEDNELDHATINVTEETIKERQGFNQDAWPAEADRGFITGVQVRTSGL